MENTTLTSSTITSTEAGNGATEPWLVIVLSIFGVVGFSIIAFLLGFALWQYRKERQQALRRNGPIRSSTIIKEHRRAASKVWRRSTVQVTHFPDYVERMKKDRKSGLAAQFKEIQSVAPLFTTQAAELVENRPKNRNQNIGLPFDNQRVILAAVPDERNSDYINASYIPGFTSSKEYIAAQGPMENTVADFWRMIWEQQIHIVVMVTDCYEDEWKKCEKYWPDESKEVQHGQLTISLISEENRNASTSLYRIQVQQEIDNEVQKHVVCLIRCLGWKELTCPQETDTMLEWIRVLKKCQDALKEEDSTKPLLVHGSAGAGRTGTFIAIDRVLKTLNAVDNIDVFRTVLELRIHRQRMVQTEEQYIFIHNCVRDDLVQKTNTIFLSDEVAAVMLEKTPPSKNKKPAHMHESVEDLHKDHNCNIVSKSVECHIPARQTDADHVCLPSAQTRTIQDGSSPSVIKENLSEKKLNKKSSQEPRLSRESSLSSNNIAGSLGNLSLIIPPTELCAEIFPMFEIENVSKLSVFGKDIESEHKPIMVKSEKCRDKSAEELHGQSSGLQQAMPTRTSAANRDSGFEDISLDREENESEAGLEVEPTGLRKEQEEKSSTPVIKRSLWIPQTIYDLDDEVQV